MNRFTKISLIFFLGSVGLQVHALDPVPVEPVPVEPVPVEPTEPDNGPYGNPDEYPGASSGSNSVTSHNPEGSSSVAGHSQTIHKDPVAQTTGVTTSSGDSGNGVGGTIEGPFHRRVVPDSKTPESTIQGNTSEQNTINSQLQTELAFVNDQKAGIQAEIQKLTQIQQTRSLTAEQDRKLKNLQTQLRVLAHEAAALQGRLTVRGVKKKIPQNTLVRTPELPVTNQEIPVTNPELPVTTSASSQDGPTQEEQQLAQELNTVEGELQQVEAIVKTSSPEQSLQKDSVTGEPPLESVLQTFETEFEGTLGNSSEDSPTSPPEAGSLDPEVDNSVQSALGVQTIEDELADESRAAKNTIESANQGPADLFMEQVGQDPVVNPLEEELSEQDLSIPQVLEPALQLEFFIKKVADVSQNTKSLQKEAKVTRLVKSSENARDEIKAYLGTQVLFTQQVLVAQSFANTAFITGELSPTQITSLSNEVQELNTQSEDIAQKQEKIKKTISTLQKLDAKIIKNLDAYLAKLEQEPSTVQIQVQAKIQQIKKYQAALINEQKHLDAYGNNLDNQSDYNQQTLQEAEALLGSIKEEKKDIADVEEESEEEEGDDEFDDGSEEEECAKNMFQEKLLQYELDGIIAELQQLKETLSNDFMTLKSKIVTVVSPLIGKINQSDSILELIEQGLKKLKTQKSKTQYIFTAEEKLLAAEPFNAIGESLELLDRALEEIADKIKELLDDHPETSDKVICQALGRMLNALESALNEALEQLKILEEQNSLALYLISLT